MWMDRQTGHTSDDAKCGIFSFNVSKVMCCFVTAPPDKHARSFYFGIRLCRTPHLSLLECSIERSVRNQLAFVPNPLVNITYVHCGQAVCVLDLRHRHPYTWR